jgi:predicted HicB family RNase H-like nuclease
MALYAGLERVSVNEMVNRLIEEGLIFRGLQPDSEKLKDFERLLAKLQHAIGDKDLPTWEMSKERKYSGTWMQRFPKSLHHSLKVISNQQGISMNMLITDLIAQGLSCRDTLLKYRSICHKELT